MGAPRIGGGAYLLSQANTWSGLQSFGGGTRVNSGSVASPPISFSADTNVGLFRSASDVLQYVTGGVCRLQADAAGAIQLGNVAAATGYTGAGDLTLPAAANVRAKNTPKAWVRFVGTGTVTISDSFNVSSITDNGTGDYTINLTNATADANYAVMGTSQIAGTTGSTVQIHPSTAPTSSACRVRTTANGAASNVLTDADIACVAIVGA